MSMFLYLILCLSSQVHGKVLSTWGTSSSWIFLRHIRLSTDDQQYIIECPYNLKHLQVQLLNYSNENCFNLYSVSNNNPCINYESPCRFHAKRIPIRCNGYLYSTFVDVIFQCSTEETIFSNSQHHNLTISTNTEENIALFLIGLCTIIIFWIIIFSICFIYHRHKDVKSDLSSQQIYRRDDLIDFNILSMKNYSTAINNRCLHINPFENNHRTT